MKLMVHEEPDGRFWPTRYFYRYWYVVGALLSVALLALQFDIQVAKLASIDNLRGDVTRILKLSEFFAHGFGIIVVLAGIWVLTPTKRRYLPRLACCVVIPGFLVYGLKIIVARKRPLIFHRDYPQSVGDTWVGLLPTKNDFGLNLEYPLQAFPSAHTATAISFALVLGWVFPRGRYLFLLLALLAAAQRIVYEAHWMSDVFVGAAIGVMVGSAMTKNWGFGYWCGLIERPVANRSVELQDLNLHPPAKSA